MGIVPLAARMTADINNLNMLLRGDETTGLPSTRHTPEVLCRSANRSTFMMTQYLQSSGPRAPCSLRPLWSGNGTRLAIKSGTLTSLSTYSCLSGQQFTTSGFISSSFFLIDLLATKSEHVTFEFSNDICKKVRE